MARIIGCGEDDLRLASQHLRDGRLVAIPTETVYGLGAHALDADACRRVFEVKGRPPTDPLIVHVLDIEAAKKLWRRRPDDVERVIDALASKFWPGALTMVYDAAENVPSVVCGGTPSVGVRVPLGSVARRLLEISALPIAAPSANRFGHISPTIAQHVFGDLAPYDDTLLVVDGGPVDIGIESTVIKVHATGGRVEIIRKGRVTPTEVTDCLAKAGLGDVTHVDVRDTRTLPKHITESQDAPGQMLTHYAPLIPAYLLSTTETENALCGATKVVVGADDVACLSECVLVDFGHKFSDDMKPLVRAYFNLSDAGDADEVALKVYAVLRDAETVEGARCVLLPDLSESPNEVLDAVADRLFRSASGCLCALK
eukprot:PhM_4_TR3623/c0_g1_i2/m.84249